MLPILRYAPLLSLLGVLIVYQGRGQTLPPEVTIFSPEDYEGHYQVYCAEPLPDGRTAFGTAQEVKIHNGEGFSTVKVGDGKHITSMDADSYGRLFIGGTSSIGVIAPDKEGKRTFHSLLPLLPDSLRNIGTIWNTVCTPDGNVYFNANEHLLRYDGDTITLIRAEGQFRGLFQIQDQLVTQDLRTGLYQIQESEKVRLPGSKGLSNGKRIRSILPTENEEDTWTVFTRNSGLYQYDPSKGAYKAFPLGDERNSLKELRQAKMYTACRLSPEANPYGAAYAVGTMLKGLYLLAPDGHILLHLDADGELPSNLIGWVIPDGHGNVWATTQHGIAFLHTGRPFTRSYKGTLFEGGISAITRPHYSGKTGHQQTPLFLATSQGAWQWRESENEFSLIEGTAGNCMGLLPIVTQDREEQMMVTGNSLLSVPLAKGAKSRVFRADTILEEQVYSITPLPFPKERQGLLLGGRSGITVLSQTANKGSQWKEILTRTNLPEDIRSVAWDTSSTASDSIRIWGGMASRGVISFTTDTAFRDGRKVHYDTAHGLPEGTVWSFQDPSPDGPDVVFGTDNGLYRSEKDSFVQDPRYGDIFADGSRQVFRIKKGVGEEVWINDWTGGHIKHLIPKEDGHYQIDSTVFRSLGLESIKAIFPEEDRTWFGGNKGIACYFPEMKFDIDQEWNCFLREVKGRDDTVLFRGTFSKEAERRSLTSGKKEITRIPSEKQPAGMIPVLPYSQNRLAFRFAAPYPDQQGSVQYSYRLDDFDTAWSKWTQRVRKEYTNLPEGEYTFRVKARNIYFKESTTAAYNFRILPPWYRTPWAYAGYGVSGGLTLALIGWLWVRKQRADQRAKEYLEGLEEANAEIRKEKEKVEEAHEELHEAHDEITSSIAYARKIQDALLQSEEHVSTQLPDHFVLFKPQSQVSGDFYWAREHKGYLYFAAVDCTGHGVPGAFMSMLGISQLNDIMNTDEVLSPGYILTDLRDRVVKELSGSDPESTAKDGMDAAMVKIPLDGQVSSGQLALGNEEKHPQGQGFNPPREEGDNNFHFKSEGFSPQGHNGDEAEKTVNVEFAGAQNPLYVIRKGIGKDPGSVNAGEYVGAMDDRSEGVSQDQNVGATRVSPLQEDRLKPFKKSADGIEIKGDPMPVGYDERAKDAFITVSLQLQKGDMVYFFSDGYADQFGGPKGKKFRYGPFKQLLASIHEKPLEEQKQELERTFEDWKAESQQEQIDDVVVIGVRI